VKLVRERGVTVAQAARDLDLHENLLRKWVKDFAADPQHAFPGQGQMKPEQLEIERLRREVHKLKTERDILKNNRGSAPACGGRNDSGLFWPRKGAAVGFLVAMTPLKNMVHGLLRAKAGKTGKGFQPFQNARPNTSLVLAMHDEG
jgi:transposase